MAEPAASTAGSAGRTDAGRTSPQEPWPVRVVSQKIGSWIARLGWIWVDGQVAQISRRPGASLVFLTLRDPSAEMSLSVTCYRDVLDGCDPPLREGSRVVLHAKPEFYAGRGSLSLRADELRHVGLGELLARLERLKKLLAAEGLFDPARKRRPPFLPRRVGLITGRASAAERDVRRNAALRWPAVEFETINVAVQGPTAVPQILDALAALDRDPAVEVIVLARGGGGVEDLLPFSDEALCRAVSACRTPVLSAIGHETDTPLVDFVADLRCSTPTDAGKRVVPDLTEERRLLDTARHRLDRAVLHYLDVQRRTLADLRSRPVLARPGQLLDGRREQVDELRDRAGRCLRHRLEQAGSELTHTRARLHSLSPAATLERGYAIVQRADGAVVRDPAQVSAGDRLRLRVAGGELPAEVRGPAEAADSTAEVRGPAEVADSTAEVRGPAEAADSTAEVCGPAEDA